MRYSIAILLFAAGCTTDIIDHSQQDASAGSSDAANMDSGDKGLDAGLVGIDAAVDAGLLVDSGVVPDAGAHGCILSVSGNFDFGTIGQSRQVQSQRIRNVGFDQCEILSMRIRDPEMFSLVISSGAALLGPDDAVQVEVQTSDLLGHLESELVITLRESREGTEVTVPISALRQGDELPCTETITFRVNNSSGQDRWVHSAGWSCTPFSLGIPLDIEFQCGCECPAPPAPQVSQLVRVPAGGQVDLTWDGRAAVTWVQRIDCGPDQMQELRMAKQPAAAGPYDVRLGVEATLPTNCNVSGDIADCTPDTSGEPGGSGGVADKCISTATLTESFVLVAGQDQVVPLTITN